LSVAEQKEKKQREERNMETKQKRRLLVFATLGSFLMVATSGQKPINLSAVSKEPLAARYSAWNLATPFL
jgi:hypothetical protein